MARDLHPAAPRFSGAIAGGCVGLHGIVGMGPGIATGIVPMMLLRRLYRGKRVSPEKSSKPGATANISNAQGRGAAGEWWGARK